MKTFPKIISSVAIAAFMASSLAACGSKDADSKADTTAVDASAQEKENEKIPDWETVEDASYTIQYPKDWTREKNPVNPNGLMLKSPQKDANDQFLENVNLIVQESQAGDVSLDQIADMVEKQVGAFLNNFSMKDKKQGKIAGNEYFQIKYTGEQAGKNMAFTQRMFITKDKSYILTYTSTTDAEGGMDEKGEKIINSFTLK